ncbi:unnamed protein product [Durusdinium trenchii]|uniref:Uncharacterized protein n=2 Tax=Durusdinium trenchii TaxID=1381693 RepID=A0ABP0K1L3_9DINO
MDLDASTSSQPLGSRRSPLLSSDATGSASVAAMRRRNGSSSAEETTQLMVRRLSEISTSSISFDASKLAMYKNFSVRSSYSRDLDGEAVGRPSRRCRTGGYPVPSRSPAMSISEMDLLEENEALTEHIQREKEKRENKTAIAFEQVPSRKTKTTVVSL